MKDSLYKLIKTEDGSCTIYNEKIKEAMHSMSGAYSEALHKHIIPSKLLKHSGPSISVIDVGFGLGYNILALLQQLHEIKFEGSVKIISFEYDKSYSNLINSIVFNDNRDEHYRKILKAYNSDKYISDKISIEILMGDAREYIDSLEKNTFQAIFHDPYSPGKNPELWTVEFFQQLHRLISREGILTTYSSAVQIRMAMILAGFHLGKGPAFGKKREGTIASKTITDFPLSPKEIEEIYSNKKSEPYHDNTFQDSKDAILKRRLNKMKKNKL